MHLTVCGQTLPLTLSGRWLTYDIHHPLADIAEVAVYAYQESGEMHGEFEHFDDDDNVTIIPWSLTL